MYGHVSRPLLLLPPLRISISPHVFLIINIYIPDGQIRIKRSSKCNGPGLWTIVVVVLVKKAPLFVHNARASERPEIFLSLNRFALHARVRDLLPGRLVAQERALTCETDSRVRREKKPP
jgi:hypothetical protein